MGRKIANIAGFLVLMVFMAGTIALTSVESSDIGCSDIEVVYSSNEMICTNEEEIIRLVKKADKDVLKKTMEQINTEMIEKEVEKHSAILNAEVYKVTVSDTGSFRGVLAVKIRHRRPVVRILSASGSYYLDQYGMKVPASQSWSAPVLAVTGNVKGNFAKEELLPFVLFLEKDPFWQAQIEQVHVQNNGEIQLTPLVGDHTIEMGTLEGYPQKMKKLRAFYEQVLARGNWNKYATVSLKYNNQVIAKKR